MVGTNWSDWDKLFARCATDEDYRQRLNGALAGGTDDDVVSLLREIGAEGSSEARDARLAALRSTREPMLRLASAFDSPVDFAAP